MPAKIEWFDCINTNTGATITLSNYLDRTKCTGRRTDLHAQIYARRENSKTRDHVLNLVRVLTDFAIKY